MTPLVKRILWHVVLPLIIGFFIYFFFRPQVAFVQWLGNREPLLPLHQLNQLQQWFIYSGPDLCWCYSLSSALFIWQRWTGNDRWQFAVLVFVLVIGSELLQGWLIPGFTMDIADVVAAILAFSLSFVLTRKKHEV